LKSGGAHSDLEFAVAGRNEGREGGRREGTLIKSRDPHLAGEETLSMSNGLTKRNCMELHV
jgi:hypothetical protein